MIRRIVGIHFSPIGVTAAMTDKITEDLAAMLRDGSAHEITTESYELLGMDRETIDLDEETVAVVGMPVYVGKVPLPAIKALSSFNPNGAVTIAAVSYGSRTYGNALYELHHYAEEQGFKVVGAGAFSVRPVSRDNLPSVAGYIGDRETLAAFGKAAATKIKRLSGSEIETLRIKPAPIDVAGRLPVHLTSRISPAAAAAAQKLLDRISIRRQDSEWFL